MLKPVVLFRMIYLGDSMPWDEQGFVSYTRETLVKEGNIEAINSDLVTGI
jgi:hypothetical protein